MSSIRIGLCTISFNNVPVDQAFAASAEARAPGVELWGREHLPVTAKASDVQRVRKLADNLGIPIISYGSYARPGTPDGDHDVIHNMLKWVPDLGASVVRVWAGSIPSAEASEADWNTVVSAFQRWGDWAGELGLVLVVERHAHSLTDYGSTAYDLISRVNRANVLLNYQIPSPAPAEYYTSKELVDDLRLHLPVSRQIHVQNTGPGPDGKLSRARLREGLVDYAAWRPLLDEASFQGWAMLEFLPEEPGILPAEMARQEMATLRELWQLAAN